VQLAAQHGLDPTFAPEVEREVQAWLDAPGIDDPRLVDLTHVPFVTIDNEGSRDLDQALHLERDRRGFRVRYALADAAHFVRPGTALFDHALSRGASYYLPGWSIPMLPRALSEGLVSLGPRVARRALVFEMRLDARGGCLETRASRARIVSRAQLTYRGVQAFLDAGAGHAYEREEFAESLRLLREVGELRVADAEGRDVVQHRREPVEIGLDERMTFVIYAGPRNDVERYNEQVSLLCNAEGARLLRRAEGSPHVQPIYRVHPRPSAERVEVLAGTLERLVQAHDARDPRWRWRRAEGQSLAAYLRALPYDLHPGLARALERQAILANVRSTYSEAPGEHHGVGAEAYARFSAPMREIVGVFLHKELCEHLDGPAPRAPGAPDDDALRERIIASAHRARALQAQLEARADRLALDAVFERDRGMTQPERPARRGTVLGITASKLYVALEEPPLEVKLYAQDLSRALGEPVELGADGVTLRRKSGPLVARIGDSVRVRVDGRDTERDRWRMSLV
jgi:ribonuclease R